VQSRIHKWCFSLCLVALFALATTGLVAQQVLIQNQAPPHIGDVNPPPEEDEAHARIRQDMEKRAAKERVAALKHDTDKLLKLSLELKESVDKSDENVLSLDVIKRAEEIEKLAHSVKEKMKGPN
jgi:hypothetical protein